MEDATWGPVIRVEFSVHIFQKYLYYLRSLKSLYKKVTHFSV